MTAFLAELRRRNVFRVAAAYLVVGWLVMQVVATIGSAAGMPDWTDSFALILLVTGFPIVLFIAWAFELTPEGLKPTAASEGAAGTAPQKLRALDIAIAAGLGLVILMLAWQQIAPRDAAPAAAIDVAATSDEAAPSVAVLPFVDLSEAGDQEYFSDGISEEILNVLVRIPGLSVAGRTSSFAFKGRNEDLRVIGEALGVNHVLEGSVRRSGTRLRITAQLIRSSDGFHIWSETYDREIADIFDIQDEIAAAVASELALSLGLDWQSGEHSRTDDIEAYEKYLRAHQLYLLRGEENMATAALLLHEVVARDPGFAPAWTALAGVYGVYDAYSLDENPDHMAQWTNISEAAARRAIALDPESGEAWVHLGAYQSVVGDWVEAFDSIDRALALAPNNSTVLDQAAQLYTQIGYIRQARELSARAIAIDPLVPLYHSNLGWTTSLPPDADLAGAIASYNRATAIDPSFGIAHLNLFNALEASGNREVTQAAFDQAVSNNALSPAQVHDYGALFQAWAEGPEAVRAVALEIDPEIGADAGIILGDADLFVDRLLAIRDKPGGLVSTYLYLPVPGGLQENAGWRELVRELGVLDLWRARGFPDGCRALGDDDFQCGGEPAQ
jgi:TolB-like protein